ncbi:alkaline phosphatase, tissue-nonspecific isozyme-like [Rhipicephalus sanguineus]|uniref:alkaline phosphatase, tissue-nonspecific isozyme-like n=1 Tax=Rhipicephalus sanguineus TaxID=34632 RepID=UPI0020C23B1B|nr:alkaline phosphatase, tissue-nonspecific isozyme-like [Rhipicephalus sanguineus]
MSTNIQANRTYWSQLGKSQIEKTLAREEIRNRAKFVILFLGDGMGVSTVTAARIYKGQFKNQSGEETVLSWEEFPYVSLSKTYGLDAQTSDSANSATAYLCGVKANIGTVGVDSTVKGGECHNDSTAYVDSIMQWAQDAGMWTGLVTTSTVTDASPAAAYAHSGFREWQHFVPKDCNASDIAKQLIYNSPGRDMRVILLTKHADPDWRHSDVKGFVASEYKMFKLPGVEPMGWQGIMPVTVEKWKSYLDHVSEQKHIIDDVVDYGLAAVVHPEDEKLSSADSSCDEDDEMCTPLTD